MKTAYLLALMARYIRLTQKSIAFDGDTWITVHPNGKEHEGQPVLIDESTKEIKGGLGGVFNGKKIYEMTKPIESPSGKHSDFIKNINGYDINKALDYIQKKVKKGEVLSIGDIKFTKKQEFLLTDSDGNEVSIYEAYKTLQEASLKQKDDTNTKPNETDSHVLEGMKRPKGEIKPKQERIEKPQNQQKSGTASAGKVRGIFKKITGDNLKNVSKALENADEHFLNALNSYCSKLSLDNATSGKHLWRCRYHPGMGRIIIGDKFAEFADSNPGIKKFPVNGILGAIRHEIGHALDNMAGLKIGAPNSYVSSGPSFQKAINEDEKRLYKEGGKRFNDFYNGKILEYRKCAPISGLFEALTYGKRKGIYGHDKGYFNEGSETRGTEIFAELTQLYYNDDKKLWDATKEMFPSMTDEYIRTIEKLGKTK